MHRGLLGRRRAAVDADVLALDRVGALHQPELLRVGQPARPVGVHGHLFGQLAGEALVEGLSVALSGDRELVVVERVGPVRRRVPGVHRVGVGRAHQRLGRLQLDRRAQVG